MSSKIAWLKFKNFVAWLNNEKPSYLSQRYELIIDKFRSAFIFQKNRKAFNWRELAGEQAHVGAQARAA